MKNPDYNEVYIQSAQPSKMFPDWMTQRMRFLEYIVAVPCAACGKKSKRHWTMLMAFKVVDMEHSFITAQEFPRVFPPLTPVCDDHPLHPIMPEIKETKAGKKKAKA